MRIVGGMKVDADLRIRTTYGHNPSSLRLCAFDPNLTNIPRTGGLASFVKDMFVAPQGSLFWERDYSAIEAVLVGLFAGSARYTKLAKMGVHDFMCSHMVGQPADLSWSDADIRAYLKKVKKEFPAQRTQAKVVIHMSNYLGSPKRMSELFPEAFPTTKDAARLQGLYFELFPEIRTWHRDLCNRVDGTKRRGDDDVEGPIDPWTLGVCYARNPFGYCHRFYNVLDWEKVGDQWVSSFGEDAKRLVSFLPQSTAAAIIKQAAKRIYYDHPNVGETLRLLIHDSIMGETQESAIEECLSVSQQVMEAPIPELPLDPEWNMGECLTIGTEAKVGRSWGDMQ